MTAAKCEHRADIDKDAVLFLDGLFECLGRETRNARQIPKNLRPLRVHLLHNRVVLWNRRRSRKCIRRKLLNLIELQELIESSFVSDRAAQSIADVRATWRTRAVIGINHYVVRHLEIEIAERVELLLGKLLRVLFAQKIGPACGGNEKRIPGQNAPRIVRMISIG